MFLLSVFLGNDHLLKTSLSSLLYFRNTAELAHSWFQILSTIFSKSIIIIISINAFAQLTAIILMLYWEDYDDDNDEYDDDDE